MERATIEKLITICREASDKICEIHRSATSDVRKKDDHSPVTDADIASHHAIIAGLSQLFPQDLLISEESGKDAESMRNEALSQSDRNVWLIDPLDGTKEFIKRNGQFTVNIGLLHKGIPTFGIIMQPTTGCIYYGGVGVTPTFIDENGSQHTMPLPQQLRSKTVAVISSSHGGSERDILSSISNNFDFVSFGSSLKFCKVAEGSADLYLRTSPTSEWDTAAADAILRSCGISITDHSGQVLRYFKPGLRNPPLLALRQIALRNSIIKECLDRSPQLQG